MCCGYGTRRSEQWCPSHPRGSLHFTAGTMFRPVCTKCFRYSWKESANTRFLSVLPFIHFLKNVFERQSHHTEEGKGEREIIPTIRSGPKSGSWKSIGISCVGRRCQSPWTVFHLAGHISRVLDQSRSTRNSQQVRCWSCEL